MMVYWSWKSNYSDAEAATQRCSWEKVFWKYAANLKEAPMPKCDFDRVALQLYRNHTSTWVLSCEFTSYFEKIFFLRTTLGGCFWCMFPLKKCGPMIFELFMDIRRLLVEELLERAIINNFFGGYCRVAM